MARLRDRQQAAGALLAAEADLLHAYDWVPYVVTGVVMWRHSDHNGGELCTQSHAVTIIRTQEEF